MRNFLFVIGFIGGLIALFALLSRHRQTVEFPDDDEIHFELYAQ